MKHGSIIIACCALLAGCGNGTHETAGRKEADSTSTAEPSDIVRCGLPRIVTRCNDKTLTVGDKNVVVMGDRSTLKLGAYNVGLVGDGSTAFGGLQNVLVGGDGSTVGCSGVMALAREGGRAIVGDGSMARVFNGGFASAEWHSAAYANANGHALSKQFGVAMASGGLAETLKEGVAVGFAQDDAPKFRAIAIAGVAGIAVALTPADLVQAGEGGLLVGYWKDATGKLVVRSEAVGTSGIKANTLYHLDAKGKFQALTAAEEAKAQADIKAWKAKDQ